MWEYKFISEKYFKEFEERLNFYGNKGYKVIFFEPRKIDVVYDRYTDYIALLERKTTTDNTGY